MQAFNFFKKMIMQLNIFRNLLLGLTVFVASNHVLAQSLAITLTNPITISATQIRWDINVQNVTSTGMPGAGTMTIAIANLPQRTTTGLTPPAAVSPLIIDKVAPFDVLSFVPQMATSSGNTVYRLNGGAAPAVNPVVPSLAAGKLGTVTFTSASPMTFPINIGSTVAAPNVSISGTYDAAITTFSLAMGNLVLPNSANATPIAFTAPLPIDLLDFNAKPLAKSNMIEWSTASERNAAWHIVERSKDGVGNWERIGKVQAAGTSTVVKKYALEDKAPLATSYYRLRSVDFDGSEDRSKVVVVHRKSGIFGVTSVYPSPTTDKVNVQYESNEESGVTFQMFDITGRLVMQQKAQALKGINMAELDMTSLAVGVYTIQVMTESEISSQVKVVKQ